MVRSGHSAVGYGHYLFLFGGIDFAEEVVYNDLYALNLSKLVNQNVLQYST